VQFEREESIYVLNTVIDIFRKGQINHLPPNQMQPWVLNASIDFLGSLPKDLTMALEIKDVESGKILKSGPLQNVSVSGGAISGSITIDADAPKLWWPTGLGKQNLYYATISIRNPTQNSVAEVTKRTGFRTIFLNRLNITDDQIAQGIAPGANWHFEVNGQEFYAKGSNLIPPDAFWPRVTEERMQRLFTAVVAGNQNMLR
jgi:beta-mannosidase